MAGLYSQPQLVSGKLQFKTLADFSAYMSAVHQNGIDAAKSFNNSIGFIPSLDAIDSDKFGDAPTSLFDENKENHISDPYLAGVLNRDNEVLFEDGFTYRAAIIILFSTLRGNKA